MPTYEIPSYNVTSGADSVLVGLSTAVPIFVPAMLLFIYILLFFTMFRKQKNENANGADIPQIATVSGVVTSIVALILSITAGIIGLPTLMTVIVITIASAIWFLSSKESGQ